MTTAIPEREQLVQLITRITQEVLRELGSGVVVPRSGPAEVSLACQQDPANCSQCGYCTSQKPELIDQFMQSGASGFSNAPKTPAVPVEIAGLIDHTLLKPEATRADLATLCQEALKYNFRTVCVNPDHVSFCVDQLKGSSVKVCAVIGFPLGATTSRVKAFEAEEAVSRGAAEIDMVINVSSLKAKDYNAVFEDIRQVVRASRGCTVKVILETGLLTTPEKIAGCVLSKAAGAHFVKTSTGFGKGGATIEDIRLMREIVGSEMGVKASGGIRDTATAEKMIEAGASRIGASASVAIVQGQISSK
ncbi:deoxyribose-phosphate aldolase [bacterium]|nr:deoxyribose-phosphate aldolase [bacterium]